MGGDGGGRRGRRACQQPEGTGTPRGQCAAREAVGLGRGRGQEAARGGTGAASTHPVQKAQPVPQRRRSRHGAGHLPAPPLFRQARAPANHCVSLTPRANYSREEGLEADFGETICA